jgi:hypothetical protein
MSEVDLTLAERIDVLGVTDYTFTLTAHAKARGWDAAFGAGIVRVKEGQSGRGERSSADSLRMKVKIGSGGIRPFVRRSA